MSDDKPAPTTPQRDLDPILRPRQIEEITSTSWNTHKRAKPEAVIQNWPTCRRHAPERRFEIYHPLKKPGTAQSGPGLLVFDADFLGRDQHRN